MCKCWIHQIKVCERGLSDVHLPYMDKIWKGNDILQQMFQVQDSVNYLLGIQNNALFHLELRFQQCVV